MGSLRQTEQHDWSSMMKPESIGEEGQYLHHAGQTEHLPDPTTGREQPAPPSASGSHRRTRISALGICARRTHRVGLRLGVSDGIMLIETGSFLGLELRCIILRFLDFVNINFRLVVFVVLCREVTVKFIQALSHQFCYFCASSFQ
jgi:hypothetical protein